MSNSLLDKSGHGFAQVSVRNVCAKFKVDHLSRFCTGARQGFTTQKPSPSQIPHSRKKRKDSLEKWVVFSWILILAWNFGGGRSGSASTLASAGWFWCYQNYNWLFYMLNNDNIISTSVSEAVEKIPADEKDYRKCSFMCFTLHSHSSYKE